MAEKRLCKSITGKSKICYRSAAAAEKAARRTHCGLSLNSYICPICRCWHLTKEEPLHKAEAIPSAAKLRRKLRAYGLLIAAQQRRFDESQAALKLAQEKAAAEQAEVELALTIMSARSYGRKL